MKAKNIGNKLIHSSEGPVGPGKIGNFSKAEVAVLYKNLEVIPNGRSIQQPVSLPGARAETVSADGPAVKTDYPPKKSRVAKNPRRTPGPRKGNANVGKTGS